MDSPPAAGAPAALPGPAAGAHACSVESADTLGKEVRESALLLGLSLGITAGLTFALQAVLSLVG